MRSVVVGALAVPALALSVLAASPPAGELPYGVAQAPWPQELGNHRIRLRVGESADAVRVHIPWRRRDLSPQEKAMLVYAADGRQVANVALLDVNREYGDIAFGPVPAPGEYLLYTMPYTVSGGAADYRLQYAAPIAPDPQWLQRNGLQSGGQPRDLPSARALEIQARSDFHRFDPMEVIATGHETVELLAAHSDAPYLLFPEDRRFPIRMQDDLPLRWISGGPGGEFSGEAARGEFYVLQIGVWAAREPLEIPSVAAGPLVAEGGAVLNGPVALNFGGTDWLGRSFSRPVSVPEGKVQALWFGVQVPSEAEPGEYRGTITVQPRDAPEQSVALRLRVTDEVLADGGEGDLWRLERLRWLNSTIGLDDEVTAPYTPLTVDGRTVGCLGRQVRFSDSGLPGGIRSGDREILARPVAMVVETATGSVDWHPGEPRVTGTSPGTVEWEAHSAAGPLGLHCAAKMGYDGYVDYTVTVKAAEQTSVRDIRLELPLRREVAKYLMGMGRKGGLRPEAWEWKWDAGRANNMVWLGDFDAGVQCKLKGPQDTWDIYNLVAGIPASWGNGGKGGAALTEEGDTVLLRAYTGERTLAAGEELQLRFGLLITPVKPLDPAHFSQRYYHLGPNPIEDVLKCEANIINIHHGYEINPNINYPFLHTDTLGAYIAAAHERDVKVKIYYTVRELSTYLPELFALRSLGTEVFTDGGGGGSSWLHEHLVSHYAPAWHHIFADGEVDGAIATTGLSRWHNYYLEGLRWLIENVGVDGLYLDGIGYDREVMRRVRKVMDRARPCCLIDFHSGNEFPYHDLRVSPANKYMEHFAYIDSLWFGEGYDYNESPDYWLVEVSGIPFGLYGEMLQGNGNPWRGMVYGMTARYYSGADPKHIWRVWDEFGIADARMAGYWDPDCPVRAEREDILATAYCRPRKTLIAAASWAEKPVKCRLVLDWEKLGLDPQKTTLYAPEIQGFQPARQFAPGDAIPFSPGRGWLLIADEEEHEPPLQVDAHQGKTVLLEEHFEGDRLGEPWTVSVSGHPGNALGVDDGALRITAAANTCAFAERALPEGARLVECRLYSGSDGGVSWGTGMALVWPDGFLRLNVSAFGNFQAVDGSSEAFAGSSQPDTWYYLRVRLEDDLVYAEASEDGELWDTIRTFPRSRYPGSPVALRLGKMSPQGLCRDYERPAEMGESAITDVAVWG